ncbi:hypothetical protein DI272_19135 [Streptomyces sp. Act143]|uniref:hypothetical protein n=1 Tax=Streptomyces sp. Act143 TaxID=2200760 RepID=UPI000D682D32|nr:hypothetical protein [Streptomyces sp. Act143]PWI16046.1 hypothetical protein DI272_19135 [Streptomyces sp. Act143]
MKKATKDAAGNWIREGDTVGGTTSTLSTILGELVQIGASKVKVLLQADSIPLGRGPLKGEEKWITAERVFLVRRAQPTRQALFTGDVDDDLSKVDRQESAWLLVRAVQACDCTDPHPVVCDAGCHAAPQGSQCPCHHIGSAKEYRDLIAAVTGQQLLTDDLPDLRKSLAETYVESGCRDSDAQQWAGEFLAHHARALAVAMRMVQSYVTADAGHDFGQGFAGGVSWLNAYAYGLDPEGNGRK